MMRRAMAEVRRVSRQEGLRRPMLLAVTVLTSLDQSDLRRVGVDAEVVNQVVRLALLAQEAGMDGVVASPQEVAPIRTACGQRFVIVTPGIRFQEGAQHDQRRVMGPAEAIRAGVDYIVVGRPVMEAKQPLSVVRELVAEMERGLQSS
jgi:orotidine-5'-phosphate decarboxylase